MPRSRAAALLAEGLRHFSLGESEKAASMWKEALRLDPANEIARSYLALLHEEPNGVPVVEGGDGSPLWEAFPKDATEEWDPWAEVDTSPGGWNLAGDTDGTSGLEASTSPHPAGGGGDVFDLIEPSRAGLASTLGLPTGSAGDGADSLVRSAKELFSLGDYSGSLELVQKALSLSPAHEEARAYQRKNEETLLAMYQSRHGPLHLSPRVLLRPDEIVWLNLDARAGFVLSRIDGVSSLEEIYEIGGLERLDLARILADLIEQGVIAV